MTEPTLTPYGFTAEQGQRAARLHEPCIIVDTSYCGDQITLDACEFSAQRVIVNHICAIAGAQMAMGVQHCS
jgi:microsomal dipeptidase-like Zn-dependent dipeptidase